MKLTNNPRKHRGISLIWCMLTFLVMFLIGGFMLDWAHVYLVGHQLQNAADAAALAGARLVAWDTDPDKINSQNKALEYALANYAARNPVNLLLNTGNNPEGDIVIGRYISQTRIFIPTLDTPNAMKVVARKNGASNDRLPLLFGSIFGFTERDNIQKYAIAMIYDAAGAGLLALAPDGRGLYMHGDITLNVKGGSIQVNSNDPYEAAYFQGNSLQILAEDINITGEYRESGFEADDGIYYHEINSSLNTGVPPVPDPYADIPEPSFAGLPDLSPLDPEKGTPTTIKVSGGEVVNLAPGYYSKGIDMSGGTVNLSAGIYHFGGDPTSSGQPDGGINMTGGTLNGNGALVHIVENGELYVNANATINMDPYLGDPYAGFSIFQARDNLNKATILGTSSSDLDGVLYFSNNLIYTEGGGASLGTQLIAYRVEIGGNGEVIINYNGIPKVAQKSYLVE